MKLSLFAFAAMTAASCLFGSAKAAEVDVCNSERVKKTIIDGSIGKTKEAARQFYSGNNPGPNSPAIMARFDQFHGTIVNIRQTKYDPTNNIRFCAAEFAYENVPLDLIAPLSLVLPKDPTCMKNFTYKIETLLDKPNNIYVSWWCR
jgi:hypothetical protein